jgi:hypothetical protein
MDAVRKSHVTSQTGKTILVTGTKARLGSHTAGVLDEPKATQALVISVNWA